jgi:beta-lactamase regulating signal transducer with metallopeptidase domain
MSTLASVLAAPAALALGAALLHFLWQGALLAALLYAALRFGRFSASGRYTCGVVTLACMGAAPLVTYAVLTMPETTATAATSLSGLTGAIDAATRAGTDATASPGTTSSAPAWSVASVAVLVWLAGIIMLGVRLAGGWLLARRLVHRSVVPVAAEIQALAHRVADQLALGRLVRIAQSPAVVVPVMVGWLKPVILLPAGILSGLSPLQIEALLAHELAHVRRHDYLVNLLQSVVETLLFYHPAVWWVSRRVRIEREHCCDDLAVAVCDRLVYVSALGELAARSSIPQVALAATDGSLLHRVRRILDARNDVPARAGWFPVIAFVTIIGGAMTVLVASGREPQVHETRHEVAPEGSRPPYVQELPIEVVPEQSPRRAISDESPLEIVPERRNLPVSTEDEVRATIERRAVEERQDQTQAERERAREIEARRQRMSDYLAELYRKLSEVDRQRSQSELRARVDEMMTQIELAKRDHERMRQLVQVGLASPSEVARLEQQMKVLEIQLRAAQENNDLTGRERELRDEYVQREREYQRTVEEQARGGDLGRLLGEVDAVLADQRALANRDEKLRMESRMQNATVVPTGDPARPGDLLIIEIDNEPDVPRVYTVQQDGTIRMPLSTPLRVTGLDTGEIQRAVVQQLTSRGLSSVAVEVQVRRPGAR